VDVTGTSTPSETPSKSGRVIKKTFKAAELLQKQKQSEPPRASKESSAPTTPQKTAVEGSAVSKKLSKKKRVAVTKKSSKLKKATLKLQGLKKSKVKGALKKAAAEMKQSVVGGFGAPPSFASPPASTTASTAPSLGQTSNQEAASSERLFGSSPSDLIIEGKRRWKPSLKLREVAGEVGVGQPDKRELKNSKNGSKSNEPVEDEDSDDEEWLDVSASKENVDSSESQQQGKSLIWKSKLELNTEVVERLRKPAEMAEFCSAIQRSMHEARGSGDNKTVPVSPPKLVQGGINPAGAALVQQQKTIGCQGTSSAEFVGPSDTTHLSCKPRNLEHLVASLAENSFPKPSPSWEKMAWSLHCSSAWQVAEPALSHP